MSERIPQLYGLRALAISVVLITHFWGYPKGYTLVNNLAAAGWLGVQLSFVLSGFLITQILWRARDDTRYFTNFYARRSIRIFPLYYVLLAVVFLALPFAVTIPSALRDTSWMYWLYMSNFAVASTGWVLFLTDITWSLSVEEQFYLVWPAIVKKITRAGMIRFCLALIVIVPIVRVCVWSEEHWMWTHMMMPLRADAFAMGALVVLLPRDKLEKWCPWVFVACATVLLGLILSGSFARQSFFAGTIGYSLVGITAGAGLIAGLKLKTLAWKPLIHMGTVSYGIYLLHPVCLMVVSSLLAWAGLYRRDTFFGSVLIVVITSAVSILAATLSFNLFESRVLKLKKYFVAERSRNAPERGVQA